MEAALFGDSQGSGTKKILDILEDANIVTYYEEIPKGSALAAAVRVIANSEDLPVMFHKGVCVVGTKSIREYCRQVF